jgi:phosphate transport system permease protein
MVPLSTPLFVIFALAIAGWFMAKNRAMSVAGGDMRTLNSLPKQHALNTALSTAVPPLAVILVWALAARIWSSGEGSPTLFYIVTIGLAVTGLVMSLMRISKDFRARTASERWILSLLIFASTVAILTTIGIVFSMLFETRNFFSQYDWRDFFFSTTWSPNFRGNSDLGIIPLIWGTLYISFIALLFAVPIGLFAAIYLSEYAGPRMRSVAKPLIEILAGIPTIVYGLFALITAPCCATTSPRPWVLGTPRHR